MAKEGRAALTRMRRLVPGAVQTGYDNWNGLVVGFGPTERASEQAGDQIDLGETASAPPGAQSVTRRGGATMRRHD
jgi:hypothetical protein